MKRLSCVAYKNKKVNDASKEHKGQSNHLQAITPSLFWLKNRNYV